MKLIARIAMFYVELIAAIWDSITDPETDELAKFRAEYPDANLSDSWPDR